MKLLSDCIRHCSMLLTYELCLGTSPTDLEQALIDLAHVHRDLAALEATAWPA